MTPNTCSCAPEDNLKTAADKMSEFDVSRLLVMDKGGNLSGIIGPIVTGVIIDRTGGYEGGFLVAAAVSIVGVAAWGFIIPQISPIDWTKR